jgi:GT2 family glycosyltransferase
MSAIHDQSSIDASDEAESRLESFREQQLRETEAQFQLIAQQWLLKEQQNQELAHGFKVKDEQLLTKDRQLQNRDLQLATRDQQLLLTTQQLQAKDHELHFKEEQLQVRDKHIETLNGQLQAKEAQLQNQEALLQHKETLLQNKETQLQANQHFLQEQRQQLHATELQLQTTDAQLRAQENQLQTQDAQLQAQAIQLQTKEAELQELARQLQITAQQLSVREEHVRDLLESNAFRIGTTLTWPLRTLRHSPLWRDILRGAHDESANATSPAPQHSMPEAHQQATLLEAPATHEQHQLHAQLEPHVSGEALPFENKPRVPPASAPPARNTGTLVIGVVTYNNTALQLAQLLRSIEIAAGALDEREVPLRLFVIDNGEESIWPDESNIALTRFASQGNIGFGRGMNIMMESAFNTDVTEWFLCLNPDGIMHRKLLSELLASSRTCTDALVEARQFPEEHVKLYDAQTFETPWASGACLLIRRRIYETIGGFDPNFFMYLEDIDFSWRARAAGFNVKISPNALLGHAVIHRKNDQRTDTSFLLSGRYLAHKWRDAKFRDWTEQELVKRGYYKSRDELPALPELALQPDELDSQLANFKHYFHFSPARW